MSRTVDRKQHYEPLHPYAAAVDPNTTKCNLKVDEAVTVYLLIQLWLLKGTVSKDSKRFMLLKAAKPTKTDADFDINKFKEAIPLLKILQWWLLKGMGSNNIEEKHAYPLLPPCVARDDEIFSMVSSQIHTTNGFHFKQLVDPFTLFNLLQEARHLQNKNLLDFTCRILVNEVKPSEGMVIDFDISQTFAAKCSERAHSSEAMLQVVDRRGSFKSINIFNSRGKETFILRSDLVDVQVSPYVNHELELLLVGGKVSDFNAFVSKLLECSEFLKPHNSMNHEKCLDLFHSTFYLEKLIEEDPRLADQIGYDIAHCLVQTLKIIDWTIVEVSCISILSHATSDICSDVMKEEALPLFVKLMGRSCTNGIAVPNVIGLTRLAYARPDYIQVIVKNNALQATHLMCRDKWGKVNVMNDLAKFLVAVCRGESLCHEKFTLDEVKAALLIIDDFFQEKINSTDNIMRACHALSYLSFERYVPIEEETFKRLVGFTFHADNSVAGSALGVVGNIARWGSDNQIQYLARDTKLLQSLGQRWLCSKFKIFQKEACHIISNIAAQSELFRKDMDIVILTDPLCRLLEEDDFDVKVEAAFSFFFTIYGGKCVQWRNQNLEGPGDELLSFKKPSSFPTQRPDATQNINYSVFPRSVGAEIKSHSFSKTSRNFSLL